MRKINFLFHQCTVGTWPERRLALLLEAAAAVSIMAGVWMFSLCMPWLITRSLPWDTLRFPPEDKGLVGERATDDLQCRLQFSSSFRMNCQ
jgi:hypothetical protein